MENNTGENTGNDSRENMAACMLSILDSLKLFDDDSLDLEHFQSFSEMMFRKMKAYNIDLNKELGFTHLKPSDNVNPLLKNHKEIRKFLDPCIRWYSIESESKNK